MHRSYNEIMTKVRILDKRFPEEHIYVNDIPLQEILFESVRMEHESVRQDLRMAKIML